VGDRGYEGGDEDTGTGTSNSGVVSTSASGRTSPYEERGRPRRGSSWWGMGYGHGSYGYGFGSRGRRITEEGQPTTLTADQGEEEYTYKDTDSRPLLARQVWNIGAIDGLGPSPVSPAVTAIRYESNENTPRPGQILGLNVQGHATSEAPSDSGGRSQMSGASPLEAGSQQDHSGIGDAMMSGVDDELAIAPLPPSLDSGSDIDISPSSAAAAELERLRRGSATVAGLVVASRADSNDTVTVRENGGTG